MNWQRHWIEAQGYDFWYWRDHIQEGLFKRDRCTVCGEIWRPDREHYIRVWGKIYGLVFDESGTLVKLLEDFGWHNNQIGSYPTGGLDDHMRLVCYYHGDRWPALIDDSTNEEAKLLMPLSRMSNYLLDIKYWTLTCLRFVKISMGSFIAKGMYLLCRDYMKAREEGRVWPW